MTTWSSVLSKIEVTKVMTKRKKNTMRTMAKGVVSAVDKLTEIKSAYRELWEAVMRMVKEQDEMIKKIAPEMLRKQKEYEETVMRTVKEQDEMIKKIAQEQAKRISENTERLKKNKRA